MARRSKEPLIDMLFEALAFVFQHLPPWTCIPMALGLLLTCRALFPNPDIGYLFGGTLAVVCLAAGWKGAELRRNQSAFLQADIDMSWVRGLSWQDFEHQVAEVYRQQGYQVEETGGGGPDGGVDLKLRKDGRLTIIQCKHWKTWTVGVQPVRELFGVQAAEKADASIFVASGRYTSEALKFAEGKPIELIDHAGFLKLVRGFQRTLQQQHGVEPKQGGPTPEPQTAPTCPRCQSTMQLRTAKRGETVGSQFWGCPNYPKCRGTLPYTEAVKGNRGFPRYVGGTTRTQ